MTRTANVWRAGVLVLAVLSMGAVPAGSCARACSKGGRAAARDSARLSRTGARLSRSQLDDVARASRGADAVMRRGTAGGLALAPELASGGDDLAHLAIGRLEHTAAALPEVEGTASKLVARPSPGGVRIVDRGGGRRLARDYARTVDRVRVTRAQHDAILQELEHFQDLATEVLERLAEAALDAGDEPYDDEPDDEGALADRGAYDAVLAAEAARHGTRATVRAGRERLAALAGALERRLAEILTPAQLAGLRAALGPPEVILYRLAVEQPMVRVSAPARPRGASPASGPSTPP